MGTCCLLQRQQLPPALRVTRAIPQILRGLATAAVRTLLCLRQAGVNLVGLGEHHGRVAAAAVMLATGQASQLAIPSRWGALPAFRRHRRCCCFRRHS